MSNLILRSVDILNSIDFPKIWSNEIKRNPKQFHISMMYPSLRLMDDIDCSKIFDHFNNPANSFRIYLHIPFCTGNCVFCYFCKISNFSTEIVDKYTEVLKREITLVGLKLSNEYPNIHIHSVFFGGGSPSILSNKQVSDIIDHLKTYFPITEDTECTMELHPEVVRSQPSEYLNNLIEAGINRVSIGIQTFDNRILKITNRRHSKEEATELFNKARLSGFENINIDLLLLLPELTPTIWEDTLNNCYSLNPDSITTYMTSVREDTVLGRMYDKKAHLFPNEYLTNLHRVMAIEKAKEQNYKFNQVDYFVKPNKNIAFAQTKTESQKIEGTQYIGLGLSSINYINFFQYYNTPILSEYMNSLKEDTLPIWKGVKLDKDMRLNRVFLLGIKAGNISISNLNAHFGIDFKMHFSETLSKLLDLNLLTIDQGELKLTLAGYLYAEEIGVEFIPQKVKKAIRERSFKSEEEKQFLEERDYFYKLD
jgi:oxygen-independent coproporphyrinogen-3 oxidase